MFRSHSGRISRYSSSSTILWLHYHTTYLYERQTSPILIAIQLAATIIQGILRATIPDLAAQMQACVLTFA
ncbi:hypothetical protein LX32DRAFT_132585 [Colletotrichum zoysiae]|uniref:Uncharacterized protein n=1 Tax=Colletotrichum zoysiae TaxID=1216348 RepID=A0AAD9H8E1_9PEZI|nr:hypothetical protein LX32DRAFT_132585 [Colletotrichum zoysiae]